MSEKTCGVCTTPLVRKPHETAARFVARKHCDRACMGIARRANPQAPTKATVRRAARRANSKTAAPTAPTTSAPTNRTTWRPNAPGWPAQPQMPARLSGAAR